MYLTPLMKGLPLEFGIGARVTKAEMMGLPDGRKNFKMGLVVLIEYWL